jgi:hypothetical protein
MAMNDTRACETCQRPREVTVYALPGIPVSVGNCVECWSRDAYPLWVAQAQLEALGGKEHAAAWFLDAETYRDGDYVKIRDL